MAIPGPCMEVSSLAARRPWSGTNSASRRRRSVSAKAGEGARGRSRRRRRSAMGSVEGSVGIGGLRVAAFEGGPAAGEQRFDGVDAATEGGGDLRHGEVVHVAQDQ